MTGDPDITVNLWTDGGDRCTELLRYVEPFVRPRLAAEAAAAPDKHRFMFELADTEIDNFDKPMTDGFLTVELSTPDPDGSSIDDTIAAVRVDADGSRWVARVSHGFITGWDGAA